MRMPIQVTVHQENPVDESSVVVDVRAVDEREPVKDVEVGESPLARLEPETLKES